MAQLYCKKCKNLLVTIDRDSSVIAGSFTVKCKCGKTEQFYKKQAKPIVKREVKIHYTPTEDLDWN